jgi:seryl-tRNA synthetase
MEEFDVESELKKYEAVYNSTVERIIDITKQLELETFLGNSLPEKWETISDEELQNTKREPLLKEYTEIRKVLDKKLETKRKLVERRAMISELEEKLKELTEKTVKANDELAEVQKDCNNLLDQIIDFEDEELRILREKKQRRDLAMAARRKRSLETQQ